MATMAGLNPLQNSPVDMFLKGVHPTFVSLVLTISFVWKQGVLLIAWISQCHVEKYRVVVNKVCQVKAKPAWV